VGGVAANLCSRNEHKLAELRPLLPVFSLELLDADEFPAEEGESYYENARAKARFGRMLGEFDTWMIGEDSGLEVAGLDGGPGLRSARFAGNSDGVARLLDALAAVEGDGRRARYVCELVCLSPELEEFRGTGVLEGSIATAASGSEGFGYDPIFIPDSETDTVAHLGNEWKRRHSHRARAAAALLEAVSGAL
jgi:XTP/dITP diphosphohydrolase